MATIAASGTGAGAREFAKVVRVQSVAGGTSPRKRTGTLRAAIVVKRARASRAARSCTSSACARARARRT